MKQHIIIENIYYGISKNNNCVFKDRINNTSNAILNYLNELSIGIDISIINNILLKYIPNNDLTQNNGGMILSVITNMDSIYSEINSVIRQHKIKIILEDLD